jgi:short-subunit dehydrogenase
MSDLFRGTTILITGASSGIGAAFSDLLARQGARLVLTGRNGPRLEAVADRARAAGADTVFLIADLTVPGAAASLLSELRHRGIVVDHLVNNAGFSTHGRAHETAVEPQLGVIDLNVRAATELALRLLPGMVERRRGGVLNVASTSAFQGMPWLTVYAASKAYLLTWSEGIHAELRGTGVRFCCLCPGPVDTRFFEANRVTAVPPKAIMQTAEAVARAGLRGYERNRSHVISGPLPRTGAWLTRLAPRALAARVAAFYGTPRRPR